jgi:hypothetical protein
MELSLEGMINPRPARLASAWALQRRPVRAAVGQRVGSLEGDHRIEPEDLADDRRPLQGPALPPGKVAQALAQDFLVGAGQLDRIDPLVVEAPALLLG